METRPAVLRGPTRGLGLSVANLASGQGRFACTTACLTAAWKVRSSFFLSSGTEPVPLIPTKGESKGKEQSPEEEKENGWESP